MDRKNLSKILAALLAVACLSMLAAGCASSGGGGGAAAKAPPPPPPEEVIKAQIVSVVDLLKAGDIAGMMANYSDDFSSDQGMNKAGMQQFLQGAKDQGFLDGLKANLDAMQVTVNGDTANVTGVGVEGAFGVLNLGFGLALRDGKWVVVSQTQQ